MKHHLRLISLLLSLLVAPLFAAEVSTLARGFATPPASARPWVYWYFMDGNLTREGMTADLEAMRAAGIGGAIFLEVNIGIPRGPVEFMSPAWRELFVHAVREADRLGIEIALGTGPGWCGTGGPWVKPEQSMQHLVASETTVTGPRRFAGELPRPAPRAPFFGERTLTPELARLWREYYRDVAVLAFPAPSGNRRIADVNEKALYQRAPYSSQPGVKPFLPAPAQFPEAAPGEAVSREAVLDLTARLGADGRLEWDVPPGEWTLLRLGCTATGQTTRPAPMPGLGFESDKFDPAALDAHLEQFAGLLIREIGPNRRPGRGLTTLHFDSWEMSAQNWSANFRGEFQRRRGYDLLPFLPAMTGRVVGSVELTERFLWDLRQTAQELVVAHHVTRLRDFAHRHGLVFSSEPYDMNPCADLTLGAVADVPMGEFWWKGFDASYSVIEAASIAHTQGREIVAAEAFTSSPGEDWLAHPGNLKTQGDWAFAAGVNRLAFHRFQHQPWP
ncbi:MAG: glycosyl hydrolase, partial [Verrucomicrobia bacterium]|nr:glycosyl hydrolase [Verrucomicrobiota bacterium]